MGKNKTINTSIWRDEKIHRYFTAEDKIFWMFLLTNSNTNNLGCYKFDYYYSSDELGYTEDVLKNILKRFVEYHKVILHDTKTNEILIKNYSKYNWTSSPTYKKGLENEFELIESAELRQQLLIIIEDYYGSKIEKIEIKPKEKVMPNINMIKEVIDYYNLKTGARLTNKNQTINGLINQRIVEGATLEEFKQVLDYKYDDWFNDHTMKKYYRPNTLFTSKFHDYLSAYQMGVPVGISKTGKNQRIKNQDDALWELVGGN